MNPKSSMMTKTTIQEYLSRFPKDEVLYYYPNPGNAGDALIAAATFQILEKLGVTYELIDDRAFDPKGKIIAYGGGGSLTNNYTESECFINKFYEKAKKLIIFPHTICHKDSIIEKLGENVDILLREEVSYEYIKRINKKVNMFLTDDIALSLNTKQILDAEIEYSFFKILHDEIIFFFDKSSRKRCFPKAKKILWNLRLKFINKNKTVLNCFRKDREKTDIHLPAGNLDLSKVFSFGHHEKKMAIYTSRKLLSYIDQYEEVRTNRLHVCIGAALLNKKVYFYPNSYYKNEAIFNFSMKNRYPNVVWMG